MTNMSDIKITGSMVCMLDWFCGVLRDNSDHSRLIYFELIDVVARPPYKLTDLLTMMTDNRHPLRIAACQEGSPDMAIQYVALNNKINIMGKDDRGKYNDKIKRETMPKLKNADFYKEKVKRCKAYNDSYKNGDVIIVPDILSGKHEYSQKFIASLEDILSGCRLAAKHCNKPMSSHDDETSKLETREVGPQSKVGKVGEDSKDTSPPMPTGGTGYDERPQHQGGPPASKVTTNMPDIKITASLVCMLDWFCGVLRDDSDHFRLVYFELIDVCVIPPYKLTDLLAMMTDSQHPLKLGARPEGSSDMAIQYVALNKNTTIMGKDKKGKYKIKRGILPKLQNPDFYKEKVKRCKAYDERYKNGDVIMVQDILSGKHAYSEKSVASLEDLFDTAGCHLAFKHCNRPTSSDDDKTSKLATQDAVPQSKLVRVGEDSKDTSSPMPMGGAGYDERPQHQGGLPASKGGGSAPSADSRGGFRSEGEHRGGRGAGRGGGYSAGRGGGYGNQSAGYGSQSGGYARQPTEYGNQSTGYGNQCAGYGNQSAEYGNRSEGYRNQDQCRKPTHSSATTSQGHGGSYGAPQGQTGRYDRWQFNS